MALRGKYLSVLFSFPAIDGTDAAGAKIPANSKVELTVKCFFARYNGYTKTFGFDGILGLAPMINAYKDYSFTA